jgi:hypothetical protein
MRGILTAATMIGLVLAAPLVARADDEADMKALIEKAIKAHGGAEKLSKNKASTSKFKGKFYGMGDGIDYAADMSVQGQTQMRFDLSFETNGMKFTIVNVLNGDKGWSSFNGKTDEMSKEAIAEGKEDLYFGWVSALYPLTEKDFKFSPLGDSKVGDKEAVGVKVSRKDHRDVNLYFDKKTNMLLKTEHQSKDVMGGGAEFNRETYYDDYKDVEGTKQPHKIVINRDGKPYVDAEITEIKPTEKLDDKVFDKPKD